MIPRGALVAGGFAVVAGGAVYLLRTSSPEPTEAPDVDPRVKWVVDSRDPANRSSDAALAIPDPLHHVAGNGSSASTSGRLASSVQSDGSPFEADRSSLRPAFVSDPALSPRFAAPASAQFASEMRGAATAVPLAPLGDPARGNSFTEGSPADSLVFAPASLADNEVPSTRPVAIGRHLIQDGDTLEAIALQNYGDRSLADFLFERNRRILKYPDLLPVGKEIVLYAPPAKAPADEAPAESAIVAAPLVPSFSLPGVTPPELAPLE
jgi:hypothetical protein